MPGVQKTSSCEEILERFENLIGDENREKEPDSVDCSLDEWLNP
jgi:hypothetical protein